MTIIESNGSRFAGEQPGSVNDLLVVLNNETLDPIFEQYGNFFSFVNKENWPENNIPKEYKDMKFQFFGNFFSISHVFNILTDNKSIAMKLEVAIRKNQKTLNYAKARKEIMQREHKSFYCWRNNEGQLYDTKIRSKNKSRSKKDRKTQK
jgi:hypothetical protein